MTLQASASTPRRILVPCAAHAIHINASGKMLTTDDPLALLRTFARSKRWILLAHAYDGVIWGVAENGSIQTSPALYGFTPPVLQTKTLQQARLFHEDKEVLIWRTDSNQFRYRIVEENEMADQVTEPAEVFTERFDEDHLLWGTHIETNSGGFTLTRHGAEGLRHALPLAVPSDMGMPANAAPNQQLEIAAPVMVVRHYLADSASARVVLSRLVALHPLQSKPATPSSQEKK